jgi:hypothetical protein
MAMDSRKRQKKLERQTGKRKSKQAVANRDKNAGLAERLAAASRHPILHCGAMTDIRTRGFGWVYLSRELPSGSIAFAAFLVDLQCLGVKNAMSDITGRYTYETSFLPKMREYICRELSAAAARKLVEGAVNYAAGLGLSPHADYHTARQLFGDIDVNICAEEFTFGKDGKPLFVAGPYDSTERCRQIVNTLAASVGEDGFDYIIPFGLSEVLPPAMKKKAGAGDRQERGWGREGIPDGGGKLSQEARGPLARETAQAGVMHCVWPWK